MWQNIEGTVNWTAVGTAFVSSWVDSPFAAVAQVVATVWIAIQIYDYLRYGRKR